LIYNVVKFFLQCFLCLSYDDRFNNTFSSKTCDNPCFDHSAEIANAMPIPAFDVHIQTIPVPLKGL